MIRQTEFKAALSVPAARRPRRLSWSSPEYFFSHFESASRFSFAQSLSCCTAFSGGPPFGPHAQTPPVFAIVMQEHDLVFRHAQTYTTSFLFCLSGFAPLRVPFSWPPKEDKLSNEKDKAVSAAARLPNFPRSFITKRRELLRTLTFADNRIISLDYLEAAPQELLAAVRAQGLEGIIGKRKDSVYEPGKRSGAWIKYRVNAGQELVIGGYIPGGQRVDSIIVGFYREKDLIYVARVRNGFLPASRRQVFGRLRSLETRLSFS